MFLKFNHFLGSEIIERNNLLPSFGDVMIYEDSNINEKSYAHIGFNFQEPIHLFRKQNSYDRKTFLAG